MTNSTTELDIFPAAPERSADQSDGFQMDERKNEFLATLAHELRNPLAPIKNGLQLMAFMKLSEEAENVRAMMARQVEQIVHLVDDLLDVSRIGCGKLVLDKQICVVVLHGSNSFHLAQQLPKHHFQQWPHACCPVDRFQI